MDTVILAAVALAVLVECELPEWLFDQTGAIRDSADVVVDATVLGLRYLPDSSKGEVEALLEVHRSWREPVPAQYPVLIHTYECGPELRFGGPYVIGLIHRAGSTYALAAVPRWEAESLVDDLGSSLLPREVHDPSGGSRGWPVAAAVLLVALVAAVYALLRRRVVFRE